MDEATGLAKGAIKSLLQRLWDESKPGLDRSGVNRFKYDAENVHLFGRDDELAFLWEFCHADNHFSWFAISGEGGSGKTRLAYTLGKILKYAPGWNYCKVDYARSDGLADAKQMLKNTPQNTLLVLDYVKWHTDSIGEWLYDLWCSWHDRNLKIRILLVERDAISPRVLGWKHDVLAAQYRPMIASPFLDSNNLMRLRPLCDTDMISVVNDYATAFEQEVDSLLIINTLKKIDPHLKRPLYALFLTDALLTGANLRTWDREDALEYVYLKERERIQFNAINLPSKLQEIAFLILLVATLSGGMLWNRFEELLPSKAIILQDYASKNYRTAPELLATCFDLPYSDGKPLRILPLEPDLIGEFFCLQELWHLEDAQRQEIVGLAMLNDLRRSAVVFDRISHDYLKLLMDMQMKKLFAEILIPDSIEIIGRNAFESCENLVSVSIPDSVWMIDDCAFEGCINLANVTISNSVSIIGQLAFFGCTSLVRIVIPDSVKHIGICAFEDCVSLKKITISSSIMHIGDRIFKNCINLLDLKMHDSVMSIGDSTFEGCKNLRSVSMPESVEHIGDRAFAFCKKLTSIHLPNSIDYLGGWCFYKCESISSINIPESLVSIKEWTFAACKNLLSVDIPDSVTTIESYAFYICADLASLSIPDTIESIGLDAFRYCPSLREVCVRGKVSEEIKTAFNHRKIIFNEIPEDISG